MATKDISDILVLKAYQKYREQPIRKLFPYDYLMQWTGECEKVCFSAMNRCVRRGYVEYGVSLRTGWITEKGLLLLNN